jgi:prephenate dehydratase/nucleotide-binding universal stress UspA family protein
MYRKILVPLDGSDFAEFALAPALSLAEKGDGTIYLVTVVPNFPPISPAEETEGSTRGWFEEERVRAGTYLDDVKERLAAASPAATVHTKVLSGGPAHAIENRVEETGMDLIVMTTHGRGPLERMWLGSVADGLVRSAPCPILLWRPQENGTAVLERRPDFSSIVVPLDGSAVSRAMVPEAAGFAKAFGSRISFVSVVPDSFPLGSPYIPHAAEEELERERMISEFREALESAADELRDQGLKVDTAVIRNADPPEGILGHATEIGASLIAMSTHGRGGVARLVLGSVADKVIRSGPHPGSRPEAQRGRVTRVGPLLAVPPLTAASPHSLFIQHDAAHAILRHQLLLYDPDHGPSGELHAVDADARDPKGGPWRDPRAAFFCAHQRWLAHRAQHPEPHHEPDTHARTGQPHILAPHTTRPRPDLDHLREAIDAVDRELVALIASRCHLARSAGEHKRAAGLPLLDPGQEAAVVRRVAVARPRRRPRRGGPPPGVLVPHRPLAPRPDGQRPMSPPFEHDGAPPRGSEPPHDGAPPRVAFQGAPGAFSEAALLEHFGGRADPLPCRDFESVGQAVLEGRADFGVLPVENTLAGSVQGSQDVLLTGGFTIIGEIVTTIRHCLLAVPGASVAGLRRIVSHPVALAQCTRYLSEHPHAEALAVYDTAGAAREVAERGDPTVAAIAARTAAERYGLEVLAEDLQDRHDNQTRFYVVPGPSGGRHRRVPRHPGGSIPSSESPRRTRAHHRARRHPGLAPRGPRALRPQRGINLTRLESRPSRTPWRYRFLVELGTPEGGSTARRRPRGGLPIRRHPPEPRHLHRGPGAPGGLDGHPETSSHVQEGGLGGGRPGAGRRDRPVTGCYCGATDSRGGRRYLSSYPPPRPNPTSLQCTVASFSSWAP